jgi:UV DNA damage endonuclease
MEHTESRRSPMRMRDPLREDRDQLARVWARNKYSVMERSYSAYRRLTSLARIPELEEEFEEVLTDSLRRRRESGSVRNALLHIWGFFRNLATPEEREAFVDGLARFRGTAEERKVLKRLLYDLARRHGSEILLESTFFDEIPGIGRRKRKPRQGRPGQA